MAKEFKKFDKEYRHLIGKPLPDERFDILAADKIKCWDFMDEYKQPSHVHVRMAVYEVDDHCEWQAFRVSLKTMPTAHKLYRLRNRWILNVLTNQESLKATIERIRINNYIGSMRRANLIDADGKIVKP